MKLFKTIKRKVGNALIPVIGTILALTILAGSVVAVALNSSKIVYKDKKLQRQNDSRQIIYIASRYFSGEINKEGADVSAIKAALKEIFPYLEITRTVNDEETIYYLWYPEDDKERAKYNSKEDYPGKWYKAKVALTETAPTDDGTGETVQQLSDVVFRREAKLEEKFAIGNLMTVYMTDEKLLPGRTWEINEVSLVESDIDTFDEAFTYMNNTGVLMIDDIAVALYYYKNGSGSYKAAGTDSYEIVYKTGNTGGNYFWQNSSNNTTTTKLYRQEFDLEFLRDMMAYLYSDDDDTYVFYYKNAGSDGNKLGSPYSANITYEYNEANDSHTITMSTYKLDGVISTGLITKTYASTLDFAIDMADYVFWINLDRFCFRLDGFETALKNYMATTSRYQSLVVDKFKSVIDSSRYKNYYDRRNYGNPSNYTWTFKWNDDGIDMDIATAYDGGYSPTSASMKEVDQILIQLGYAENGKVSSRLIYDAIMEEKYDQLIREDQEKLDAAVKKILETRVLSSRSGRSPYYTYSWVQNYWLEKVFNSNRPSYIDAAVTEYVERLLNLKYVIGYNGDRSTIGGGQVDEIVNKSLFDVKFFCDGSNYCKITYHYYAMVHTQPNNPAQVEKKDCFSETLGDDIYFWADGRVTQGNPNNSSHIVITTYTNNQTTSLQKFETFARVFVNQILRVCNSSYNYTALTEEELIAKEKETRKALKNDLEDYILYNYQPDNYLYEIMGKGDSSTKGLKTEAMQNNLMTFFLSKEIKNVLPNVSNYKFQIRSYSFVTNPSGTYADYINLKINYRLSYGNNYSSYKDLNATFAFKLMTYNMYNTYIYDSETDTYSMTLGTNYKYTTDEVTGEVVGQAIYKEITNLSGNKLSYSDLSAKLPTLLATIPYKERATTVCYGQERIYAKTEKGELYEVVSDYNELKNVNRNIMWNGNINDLPTDDFVINVKDGCSLFINGNLYLKTNQKLKVGSGGLVFINGILDVFYEYVGNDTPARDIPTSGSYMNKLSSTDVTWYRQHGVDIDAANAKIIVNGNMQYRGYKARYRKDGSTKRYQQNVFCVPSSCTQDASKHWTHDTDECRGLLKGIFIINGDLKFLTYDENNTPSAQTSSSIYTMNNAFSNPLINGTFYIDGTFNMTGLYASSLYDRCRANFVFAKSIIQPKVALNVTVGSGVSSDYTNWSKDKGYLFMICEDAVNLSDANFASVNLFTPYQQLVNAIDANNTFERYIKREDFLANFSDRGVIETWGLPSLILQRLQQIYAPIDVSAITLEYFDTSTDDDW